MADYVLSCCSTADLSEEHFTERNISYICFHFELDGKQYPDDLGKSIPFDKFYTAMANGSDTKTSQINANEFETYFEPFLQQGKDILHVTLSSGISGVLNSACLARDVLREKYPERKILIVDSLAASSGYGLLMDKLADLRDEGSGIDEVYQWCLDNRLHVHHWFFSTDLTFYIKGGRVSKTAGFVGGLLNICPLLNMDYLGRLIPRFKDGTVCHRRYVVHREMLYLTLCLQRGRSCCGSPCRGTFSGIKRKNRNLSDRHNHWKPHRSRNRRPVFLGYQPADRKRIK